MKILLQNILAVLVVLWILTGRYAAADGPHVPAGQERKIVAQFLAAPREYDIFFGKRDRLYLTGLWKFKWEWNYLTAAWVERNMVAKRGRQTGLWLKPGVVPPQRNIPPQPEYFKPQFNDSAWWDVLAPSPWQERMPYEKEASRQICDRYVFGGVPMPWGQARLRQHHRRMRFSTSAFSSMTHFVSEQ